MPTHSLTHAHPLGPSTHAHPLSVDLSPLTRFVDSCPPTGSFDCCPTTLSTHPPPTHSVDSCPLTLCRLMLSYSSSTQAHLLPPLTHAHSLLTDAHVIGPSTHAHPLSVNSRPSILCRLMPTHSLRQLTPTHSLSTHAYPLTCSTSALPSVPPTIPSNWSNTLAPVTIQPFTSVGSTVQIPDSPIDIFNIFFTEDFLQGIVEESNRYARQVLGQELFDKWTEITLSELRAYMGFCILIGINKLPSIEAYLRRDPSLHYSPIAHRRDRFHDITRYCQFVLAQLFLHSKCTLLGVTHLRKALVLES